MFGFIKKQLLRVNCLQLVIALIVLGIMGTAFCDHFDFYLKRFTNKGLEQITTVEQLQRKYDSDSEKLVSFMADQIIITNWVIFKNYKPDAVFLLAPIEDNLVTVLVPISFVKKNANKTGLTFKGIVRSLTAKEDIIDSFADEDIDKAQLRTKILPYMIHCYDDYGFETSPLIGAIALVLSLLFIIWKIINLTVPKSNRLVKRLTRYGDMEHLEESIAAELVNKVKFRTARIIITESWLVQKKLLSIDLVPLEQIVWVYKHTTKHYYGFIPTGNSYSLAVNTTLGTVHLFDLRTEKQVDELIDYFERNLPWIICGYSTEMDNLWSKNRSSLITEVNNRKNSSRSS